MKYRKKPVVIEAVQWNGEPILFNVPKWLSNAQRSGRIGFITDNIGIIKTLKGNMVLSIGDYIIKDVQGEIYPCNPDIFEATYEKAGE